MNDQLRTSPENLNPEQPAGYVSNPEAAQPSPEQERLSEVAQLVAVINRGLMDARADLAAQYTDGNSLDRSAEVIRS